MDDERHFSLSAEGIDKRFITVGFRTAQPIVTVDYCQREPPGADEAMKERQQGSRIRPARHRHQYVMTRNEQLLLTDRPNKVGQESRSCGRSGCSPHDRRLAGRWLMRSHLKMPQADAGSLYITSDLLRQLIGRFKRVVPTYPRHKLHRN